MKFTFVLLLSFFALRLFAQTAPAPDTAGTVRVIKDVRLQQLVDKQKAINKSRTTMDGYRIQLISNSKSEPVKNERSRFVVKYPDVPAYYFYEQPYYKVRVGDFRTRMEAQRFLDIILPFFRGAFIVQDQVKLTN